MLQVQHVVWRRQAGGDAIQAAGSEGLVEEVCGEKGRIAHHGETECGVRAACMINIFCSSCRSYARRMICKGGSAVIRNPSKRSRTKKMEMHLMRSPDQLR